MKEYHLKSWNVTIENRSKEQYHFICDQENIVILDSFKDFITFIGINEKENIILERLPYFVQYKIDSEEKKLCVIIF